ncbi:acyl-homoserine-lactone synthase [Asticcacaulis benevestitus]|uniref:Acyl-homoserine-lactone synthase n=1 Tax=Asticcacaulis benevestitus DSM 16100 = ATCC BAA-896 TaxID=1121022 RepID=V4PEK8_9CAUL|nr:acyl-homoserine-lactone synthase [Asticcacaulis benevestitus]ESQ83770.1 hypothetical protein ABENE_20065 [Asticcacaulis benevestitus DSM 16100 = ATCC BAA-896]
MLKVISYSEISRNADLFFSQFQLRHREFVERQQYGVKTLDQMEFDQYDTLASVYLVYSEDGKTALGCSRLTPIQYGCMLAEHFPSLVDDHSLFKMPRIWEGTRFCVDSRLPPDQRLKISRALSGGYVAFGLNRQIDQIIGLMPTLILRTVFERAGIELRRLGSPQHIGAHAKIQAASIPIRSDQMTRFCDRTGLRVEGDRLEAEPVADVA